MKNYLIIDIETSSKPESELIIPEFEPSKVLKDPEKIKASLEEKKREWLSDGALHAERGYVLAVGMLTFDHTPVILEGEEKDILRHFWATYVAFEGSIVGHCIKGFDMPFLMRRSWILGVPVPQGVIDGRYLSKRFLDTMETWACGNNRDMISLDNLAKAFGLPGKNGKSADFAPLYVSGDANRQKALDYLRNDLTLTQSIADKMGLL